jgi:hypothetical protein
LNRLEDPKTSILDGIVIFIEDLEDVVAILMFFLVVRLLLPLTQSDKETRSKFQTFLFNGFANPHEL